MFEYIDFQIVAASLLLLISVGLLLNAKKKSNKNWELRLLLLFAILLPFYYSYDISSRVVENIQSIKNGNKLLCVAGLVSYKVSTKDGWSIDKNYFIKESVLIRADMCEDYE